MFQNAHLEDLLDKNITLALQESAVHSKNCVVATWIGLVESP